MIKPPTRVFWSILAVSAALHTLLVLGWFQLQPAPFSTTENAKTPTINITIKSNFTKQEKPSIKNNKTDTFIKPQPVRQLNATNRITKEIEISKEIRSTNNNNNNQENIKYNKTSNLSALHALLYNEINKNRRYPNSALRLQREGTVQVTFKLLKNGVVNNLIVENSSGFNSLDKAAMLAVKNIQPFYAAKRHLQEPHNFTVDIIFQL